MADIIRTVVIDCFSGEMAPLARHICCFFPVYARCSNSLDRHHSFVSMAKMESTKEIQ